jgi:hypothetical protein
MTREIQKKEERDLVNLYFTLQGGAILKLEEGNEPPDFQGQDARGRLGIEVTFYHQDITLQKKYTLKQVEVATKHLKECMQQESELHGYEIDMSFHSVAPGGSKTGGLTDFLKELKSFVLQHKNVFRCSLKPDGELFPLLSQYVDKIRIWKGIEGRVHLSTNFDGGWCGLTDDELYEIIHKKGVIVKKALSEFDYLILIIGGRNQISQLMGWVTIDLLNSFIKTNQEINHSPFDEIGVVSDEGAFSWTRTDKKWVSVAD